MKNLAKSIKIILIISALSLIAGALFLCAAFSTRLPRGVIVNGVDIGGLTYSCAEKILRQGVEESLKEKRLRICAGELHYEYTFPEIYYADNFSEGLKNITAKGEYSLPVQYYLNGAESIAEYICRDCERTVVQPYAVFNYDGEPFTYYEGCDGVKADKNKLLEDISLSINGGWEEVNVDLKEVKHKESLEDVKLRTVKLYSFTTYFDAGNSERSSNIRLAAGKINGTVLKSGECFSFNKTVGARTEENGFKQAKIIEDGKFVLGFGGGVCQVSTTLYNAAILSGLKIEEYHPHSLAVSYVAPSRDAMVSGSYSDLRFSNDNNTPVYIRVKCTQNSICCTFYGESDGYNYSFKSEIIGSIPRPDDEEVEGDEDKILSYGRDGTLSLGYLVKERDGEQVEELIRKDKYAPVKEVRQVKKKNEVEDDEV